MLELLNNDPFFFHKILWTDESCFTTAGVPNRKNLHYWSIANPEKYLEIKRSGRRSLNVWCGLKNNKILGPIFYQNTMTGDSYLRILRDDVEELIDNMPLNEAVQIVWQQDGAPPHNVAQVRDYLNNKYQRWIGKYGTIIWPPNSPDLALPDTFLWGHLKNKIYFRRHENVNIIKEEIRAEINNINTNHPDWITNALNKLKRGYQLCIQMNGGHFQHLAEYSN